MTIGSRALITDSSFHVIRTDMGETALATGLSENLITTKDAEIVRQYIAELQSCRDISTGRSNKLIYTLMTWRRFIGPYDCNDITALYSGITAIKSAQSKKGRAFKQNTISDLVAILKQFYRWLIENSYSTIPEKKLNNIRTPMKDTMTKVAADLLTPGEITAMVKVCNRLEDRTIIMTLYEGGFRIGELGTLTWGDVKFDQYGVIVNVNFKTDKPRYIRLIMAKDLLAQWRSSYIYRSPEGSALVFVNEYGKPLTHATISKRLRVIAKKAGITKHVTPHLFRHSRITHMMREGVPESVIKLTMWGNMTTDMFNTYAHLTGEDIDQALLKSYGINPNSAPKKEPKIAPVQCPHCAYINSSVTSFCGVCGRPLTEEVKDTVEQANTQIETYLSTPAGIAMAIKILQRRQGELTPQNPIKFG